MLPQIPVSAVLPLPGGLGSQQREGRSDWKPATAAGPGGRVGLAAAPCLRYLSCPLSVPLPTPTGRQETGSPGAGVLPDPPGMGSWSGVSLGLSAGIPPPGHTRGAPRHPQVPQPCLPSGLCQLCQSLCQHPQLQRELGCSGAEGNRDQKLVACRPQPPLSAPPAGVKLSARGHSPTAQPRGRGGSAQPGAGSVGLSHPGVVPARSHFCPPAQSSPSSSTDWP